MKYLFLLLLGLSAMQLKSQSLKNSDTLFKFRSGDFLAVNDRNVTTNLPFEFWSKYGERIHFSKDLLILENPKTRKYGVIDTLNKKIVLQFLYEKIWNMADSVLTLKSNNLMGLYFPKDNVLVNAENYKVDYCAANGNYFTLRNDTFQFYNKKQKLIFQKDSIKYFVQNRKHGLIEITESERVGLIDVDGQLILEPAFISITILDNGNFVLPNDKGEKGIYRRKDLKKLSKVPFYSHEGFKGITVGFGNDVVLFYNDNGELLSAINCTNTYITRNLEGDFLFQQKNLWGIVSFDGKIKKRPFLKEVEIIPGKNYFKGKVKDKWAYFDFKGNALGSDIPASPTPDN